MRVFANLQETVDGTGVAAEAADLDVSRLYKEHAAFVWAALQRLGVRQSDLEDVLHEVFVVVHRKVGTFDHTAKVTTWLFGICMRVASSYRRRGFRRRETSHAEVPERESHESPEQELATRESRRRLESLLDELDLDRRAVFVMFEIEELPCTEIADMLGVPLNTVYSRLHAARKDFQAALARMHARDAHSRRSL